MRILFRTEIGIINGPDYILHDSTEECGDSISLPFVSRGATFNSTEFRDFQKNYGTADVSIY